MDTTAPFVVSIGYPIPAHIGDTQREKQLPGQKVQQMHTGDPLYDTGEKAGGTGVVGKMGARFIRHVLG